MKMATHDEVIFQWIRELTAFGSPNTIENIISCVATSPKLAE